MSDAEKTERGEAAPGRTARPGPSLDSPDYAVPERALHDAEAHPRGEQAYAAVTADGMDGAYMSERSAAPAKPSPKRKGRTPHMFAPFEWWISWRYLRAKKKENFASIISVISFLGIMLGVAVLITVMAVMNGFRTDLLGRILGVNGHLAVQSVYGNLDDFDTRTKAIRQVPGVTFAAPVVDGGVMAVKDGQFGYTLVRGIRQQDLAQISLVSSNIIEGSMENFRGSRTIMIGSRAAARFGIGVGDKLTLLSPQGRATPFGTSPREKAYEIGAIFNVGMSDIDGTLIYMPLEQAQLYFNTGEDVTKIDVMVEKPDSVKQWRLPVLDASGDTTRVQDWQQLNSTFVSALQVERNVMFIILAMIIVVASLNIISGLIMLVKDKGRDIAVLRTMGATKGAVLRVFLISGASIGVVGTLAGFGLGLILCDNIESIRQFVSMVTQTDVFSPEIYFLSRMTAEINNGEVLAVVFFSLLLSLLAPLYPAWRAARLDPVEALRYE